ncbi:Mov34/MPN/PAD-1 family protein [Paenibacillus sp. FJAT-27812]|uniref:Mov34/MPN/PAD-1 family protein n=1 Tax=Paenibacillus sp. FJAT-27812 TaxID=1684143 RepID=UPI0006A78598|nr:M67 family metallopeptidase [Paenibacillus sp. FJAT-27812]
MTAQQSKGYITKSAYEQLIQICLDAKPLEACGIVVSSESNASPLADRPDDATFQLIDTIIPIKNIHIDPTRSFAFDPAEWTAAFYDMQKNRQTLVGLFHSHPRTEAIPSSSDSEGFLPASELSYWIVSLQNSAAPQVKPYRLTQGTFLPLHLVFA